VAAPGRVAAPDMKGDRFATRFHHRNTFPSRMPHGDDLRRAHVLHLDQYATLYHDTQCQRPPDTVQFRPGLKTSAPGDVVKTKPVRFKPRTPKRFKPVSLLKKTNQRASVHDPSKQMEAQRNVRFDRRTTHGRIRALASKNFQQA
jgi:hypothetical protein